MIPVLLRTLCASALLLAGLLTVLPAERAAAQDAGPLQISWEVRNRFRLFREERDFLLHVENARNRSILAAEQSLELQSEGRGWARNMVNRLCIDLQGRVNQPCTRDNTKENYLTPIDHPVTVRLVGAVPVGATCAWSFDDGDGPQQSTFDCAEPINLRVRYGKQTVATSMSPRAPIRPSGSRPRSRSATSSSPASGTASPRVRAIRTGRWRCPTRASASAPIPAPPAGSTTGRAATDSRAAGLARPRIRSPTGNATARSGSTRPATARCTATRRAPRWRSPCATPTSP